MTSQQDTPQDRVRQQLTATLREAIHSRQRVRLRYLDSVREVSPLSVSDNAPYMLAAWHEESGQARLYTLAYIREVTPAPGVHFLTVAGVEGDPGEGDPGEGNGQDATPARS